MTILSARRWPGPRPARRRPSPRPAFRARLAGEPSPGGKRTARGSPPATADRPPTAAGPARSGPVDLAAVLVTCHRPRRRRRPALADSRRRDRRRRGPRHRPPATTGCLREGARSYVKVAPPGRGPLRDAGFDQRVGAEPLDRRRGGQDGSRATRRTSTNLLTRSLVATAPPLRSFAEPSSRAAPPEKDRNPVQTVAARWTCSATPCGRPASTDGDQHPVAVGRVGDLSDPAEGAHLAAPHPGHKGRRCGLLPGPARRRTEPGRGTHRPGSRRLPSDRRRPRPRPVPSGPQASPPSSPPAIRGTAQQRVTRRSTPGGHGRLDSSRRRGGSDRGQPGRTPSLGRGLAGAGDDRAHLNVGFRPLPQTTRRRAATHSGRRGSRRTCRTGGRSSTRSRSRGTRSPKTTKLYDRTADTVTVDEIERIVI